MSHKLDNLKVFYSQCKQKRVIKGEVNKTYVTKEDIYWTLVGIHVNGLKRSMTRTQLLNIMKVLLDNKHLLIHEEHENEQKLMIDPSWTAIHIWPGDGFFWSISTENIGLIEVGKHQKGSVKRTQADKKLVQELVTYLTIHKATLKSKLPSDEAHEGEPNIVAIRFQGQRWYFSPKTTSKSWKYVYDLFKQITKQKS